MYPTFYLHHVQKAAMCKGSYFHVFQGHSRRAPDHAGHSSWILSPKKGQQVVEAMHADPSANRKTTAVLAKDRW